MKNIINIRHLNFCYTPDSKLVLNDICLDIPENSFFVLLGPNGAGKTTLFRLIAQKFQTEKIIYESSLLKNDVLDLKKIGVLLENPGVYKQLSLMEYLVFFGKLYGLKNLENRIQELLTLFSLNKYTYEKLKNFSLGNLQKVQMVRTLLHKPFLLLLDEPAANLDPIARETLWNLLLDYKEKYKATIIVSSHILKELEIFASDFAILYNGKIQSSGNLKEWNNKATEFSDSSFRLTILKKDLENALSVLSKANIPVVKTAPETSLLEMLYKKALEKE